MHSQVNEMQRLLLRVANAIRQRNTIRSDSDRMATNSIRYKSLAERNEILFSLGIFTSPAFFAAGIPWRLLSLYEKRLQ